MVTDLVVTTGLFSVLGDSKKDDYGDRVDTER